MNLSIAMPAMVNSSILPCLANGSDARDTCNATLPGFWAEVSVARRGTLAVTQMA